MGRRKIDIQLIKNERCRQVTFSKRKLGVIRKATELSVLCDTEVALIIFGDKDKLSCYSSSPINMLVNRYFESKDRAEMVTTEDYFRAKAAGASNGAGTDDEEPSSAQPSASAWPIVQAQTSDGNLTTLAQPVQAFAQVQAAYHTQYSPNMPTITAAPVGQTMQTMQDMMQLQQQQQLLQQQQLQQMREQINQQQEMLQRFQQMQSQAGGVPAATDQTALIESSEQSPDTQGLNSDTQLQTQPLATITAVATQAMEEPSSSQNLQLQLQKLQEQQTLVQQQLDTLQGQQ